MACMRRPLPAAVILIACAAALAVQAVAAQTPAGVTEITRESDGQTVHVPLGGTVAVRMGTDLDWTVSFDPPDLLRPMPGVGTLERGVQALLRATQAGTTTLTAEGKPHCNPGQICAQFIVSVIVTLIVDPGDGAAPPPSPVQAATPAVPTAALPSAGSGMSAGETGFGELLAAMAALAGAGLLLTGAWRLRRRLGPQRPFR